MEEYLDILNSDGTLAGYTATKKEAHEKGLWHKTAHVWCFNSNKEILLQHRSKDKKNFPDTWDISAAGHISSGESSLSGAIRETKEEIGINVSSNDLKYLGTVTQEYILNNGTYFENEFQDVYIFKIENNFKLKIQEEELDQIKWISISEFKKWVDEKRLDLVPHPDEYKLLFDYLENNL